MDETTGTPSTDEPGFPGLAPPAAPAAAPYRVLARKYRPQSFDDLIGQGAMVRTLANAFEAGRIPQAWMLTGVRGVGKTTTARILARGLNYALAGDAKAGPTIRMPTLGLHCAAIMESRHIDVLEMDAASHTGIDDVRQIIDGIRYAPVSARYKVYIVDEVHMLSEKAFNAFLKTLEEPPPHAKFVFATTEIRKVPVTILSRCQRFDLRRVEAGTLVAHLHRICDAEGVAVEPEALAAIARAAEGSVRDSLSLLDQAIAHGAGRVTAETVRDMLGLADRARIIDLFEAAMRGDAPAAFAELHGQYEAGADPAVVLQDLAGFTHLVTRLKVAPETARADTALSEAERGRGSDFADRLSVRALSRAWQILLRAIPEVQAAPRPLAAAEMALVRLIYAADLPTPDEALRQVREGGGAAVPPAGRPLPAAPPGPALRALPDARPAQSAAAARPAAAPAQAQHAAEPALRLRRFEDVVALAEAKRDIGLKAALERDVHLVRFEEGRIEFRLAEAGRPSLANDLARALDLWTGRRWVVALSRETGEATLAARAEAARESRHQGAAAHPLVQEVLKRFPGAQIVDVRERPPEAPAEEFSPEEFSAPEEPEADQ
ncbi:DNA polymerase III, subunits gamma and tau [Methylobacterium sp. 4-46]|uniref:DNA polymerase III subunit gamma/tau n=1 Tax=unclassified Methylobacterium TaxID=2615210 RepID=UPI000165CA7C|nr:MULTISPECIES: DNA polymerase III subunit gamma/tau [Methylobacterium]ACA18592.1 DNA polymerase III, subunits gamma and tau [Methylobacterium sp. 4-46]WFT77874.1 DNA polymerase III subunit gamma/tau [Methylobacterium nodulans]